MPGTGSFCNLSVSLMILFGRGADMLAVFVVSQYQYLVCPDLDRSRFVEQVCWMSLDSTCSEGVWWMFVSVRFRMWLSAGRARLDTNKCYHEIGANKK